MKLFILAIMALGTTSAFASEGQFSKKLDGTYKLTKVSGDKAQSKDCSNTVTIKVTGDNSLEISGSSYGIGRAIFANSCDGKRNETCITSTEESYEISGQYTDDGTNMKGTAGTKFSLGALDKDKLIVKGYDYLNAFRYVGLSRSVTCTYKRQ